MKKHYLLLFLCFFASLQATYAQELKAKGYFLSDSVMLGGHVDFSLSLKHPSNMEILFPDSTFDFGSFEWVSKRYFPTKSTEKESLDSVVYRLRTFEMDSTQHLTMPVYMILQEGDTSVFESRLDSVNIAFVLKAMPDTVRFATNTHLLPVSHAFNYPFWIAGFVIFLLILVLVFVVFGSRIREYYRLKRVKTQYEVFVNAYDLNLRKEQNHESANDALALWKGYLEKVKKAPFSSLTSKEILNIIPDDTLGQSLKNIDRAIYGGQSDDTTRQSLQSLKSFALATYQSKINDIKNA
jgi:hypothetical protein